MLGVSVSLSGLEDYITYAFQVSRDRCLGDESILFRMIEMCFTTVVK